MTTPTTMNTAGTGISNWWYSQPPITRAYAAAIFIFTFVSKFQPGVLNLLFLNWGLVLKKYQIWRVATCFCFAGKFSFSWLIKIIWLLSYGGNVESQTYRFVPAKYLMLLLFGMATSLLISFIASRFGFSMYFLAEAIIYMLLYTWSREFPDMQVSIYGLFKVLSFYVPFIFIGLDMIIGGGISAESIVGLFVGHLHYFLTVLRPAMGRRDWLIPPSFLVNILAAQGIGRSAVPPPEAGSTAATGGFRAFHGQGRRLAD